MFLCCAPVKTIMSKLKSKLVGSASVAAFVALSLCADSLDANAASVTYPFNKGLEDSTSGGDLSASPVQFAVGTQDEGAPRSCVLAWDPTRASGNYLLNFGQRGLGSSGLGEAALHVGAAAALQFTLTPNRGESLNFSASSLHFKAMLYADYGMFRVGYQVWADTGSGFVAVGRPQVASPARPGSLGRLKQINESTDVSGFLLTAGSIGSSTTVLKFNLSSLGVLATNQNVKFAITMSSIVNNQMNFGSGIDDLTVDKISTSSTGSKASRPSQASKPSTVSKTSQPSKPSKPSKPHFGALLGLGGITVVLPDRN